jgi:hypothetical protein
MTYKIKKHPDFYKEKGKLSTGLKKPLTSLKPVSNTTL